MKNSIRQGMGRKVAIEASTAIIIAKAGLSDHLSNLYHIAMAKSVFEEVTRQNLPGSKEYLQLEREQKVRRELQDELNKQKYAAKKGKK